MGIPRLISTLEPFAQRVQIGEPDKRACQTDDPLPSITTVVIDGPSLVYHVYQTLCSLAQGNEEPWISQPGYEEISHAVLSVVQYLQEQLGVRVLKIFFDGGLPHSKRSVRLDRLDRGRAQLVAFRRQYKGRFDPFEAPSGTTQVHCPVHASNESNSAGTTPKDFLKPRKPVSPSLGRLPAPPFMVPATIEVLRNALDKTPGSQEPGSIQSNPNSNLPETMSQLNTIVEQVDGEADEHCAQTAAHTGAAILTSDSDLMAFDLECLGHEGSVISLDSLDISTMASAPALRWYSAPIERLTAMMYQKSPLCRKLGISKSSYQRFCFYRSQYPEATTSQIIAWCKEPIRSLELEASFRDFQSRYAVSYAAWPPEKLAAFQDLPIDAVLQVLDPRLSELFLQLNKPFEGDQELYIYFPTMLEDPDRDSAWSYGEKIRGLAYTFLAPGCLAAGSQGGKTRIVEYQRRGNRVVGVSVPVGLSSDTRKGHVAQLIQTYRLWRRDQEFRHPSASIAALWKLLGMRELQNQRSVEGKAEISAAWCEPFLDLSKPSYAPLDWDEIHLHACLNAILYSFRMLKQSLELLTKACKQQQSDAVLNLYEILATLPSIPSLMNAERPDLEAEDNLDAPKPQSRPAEQRQLPHHPKKSPNTAKISTSQQNHARKRRRMARKRKKQAAK